MKRHLTKIVILLIICFLAEGASAGLTDLTDVEITKTANVSSVWKGDVFTYSLFIQNQTIYLANDVKIIDKLANGLILQSWTRG